ncbi:unnamed protein product (macronuclear) [Paramecium tetraurelia]|uniref:Signal transduction histidine kinase dimerisation/phosphoacceptor domain-containing protein n=1 Tax=Paramecium tetraurelia TaxID=5888 RepID=A0DTC5_PARTE|nr:uncharacterized protein GSPATT00019985001 [Paramecium tetraurelia]CAK86292.1 unnamed protein product [Paramecium tetraurelia]|eukprot:XP_001453689.1 hypothetical protein (macronuclear) [Paramecium tetraurelia strain d4-2]
MTKLMKIDRNFQGDTLKHQHSNQFNDDKAFLFLSFQTNDLLHRKKRKFGQFRDSQYLLDKIHELKQKNKYLSLTLYLGLREAFMISLRDLRDQQMIDILNDELEESRRKNQNEYQVLATVFHDFRTPMNGISTIVVAMEEKFEIDL